MFKEVRLTFWKILFVGILIPVITPLLIVAYIKFIPGDRVGSVDGWLNYLGGYSGGLLAFISAYFLFHTDQKMRNQTRLNIRTCPTSAEDVSGAKYHAYFIGGDPKGVVLEAETGRVSGVDDYYVIKAKIKNISPNYAAQVKLLIDNKIKNYEPRMYISGGIFTKYDSMAELEPNEEFVFILHVDPFIWGNSASLDAVLSSTNLRK
jgi:hypothetical protein